MAEQRAAPPKTFTELILRLQHYWSARGCAMLQGYDLEVGAVQDRPEKLELEIARERRHGADTQDLAGGAGRTIAHDIHQLVAGAPDGLGVVERDPPCLGELEAAAAARKEHLAQAVFQLLQLDAQRRRREVQALGGAGDAQLAGDGPKITQMVIIEEGRHAFLVK